MHIAGMPGIGGSLGQCQVCGQAFVAEIILDDRIVVGHITGMDCDVAVHKSCSQLLKTGMNWEDLPDGPIREMFAESSNNRKGGDPHG